MSNFAQENSQPNIRDKIESGGGEEHTTEEKHNNELNKVTNSDKESNISMKSNNSSKNSKNIKNIKNEEKLKLEPNMKINNNNNVKEEPTHKTFITKEAKQQLINDSGIFSPLKPKEILTGVNVWNLPVPKLEKGTDDISVESVEIIRDKEVM